jgi:hypothetical protein
MYILDASNCGLTHVEEYDIKKMNRTDMLYLRGNKIQYIKPGVLSPKVIFLDLSHNKIALLNQVSFPSGSSLRQLHLSGNPLEKISPADFVNTTRLTRLNLKSCGLQRLWDSNESGLQPLKALSYLNLANNKITNLNVKDFKYVEYVQTLVLSGNPLTCNNDLKELIKLLTENGVASSDATERKQFEEIKSKGSVVKYESGWKTFMSHICEEKQSSVNFTPKSNESSKQVMDPEPVSDESSKTVTESEPPLDDTEMVTDEDIIFRITPDSDATLNYFPEDIHKHPVRHTKASYMWPIIIVILSALSIILAFVILAGLLLRWTRQKNSYRRRFARRHSICRTPRSKRGSTLYQQLYEDPNSPTTPVMMSKVPEHASDQQTYTFPDKDTNEPSTIPAQPINKISYLSNPFHHTNIVPESI